MQCLGLAAARCAAAMGYRPGQGPVDLMLFASLRLPRAVPALATVFRLSPVGTGTTGLLPVTIGCPGPGR
jgi:hypothetical protein